jgi:hypothetical protein
MDETPSRRLAAPGDVYGQSVRCLDIAEQALQEAGAALGGRSSHPGDAHRHLFQKAAAERGRGAHAVPKAAAERGRGAHAVPTETARGPAPPSLNAGARAEGLDANSLTAGPSDFPFAGFVDPEWLVEFEIDAIVPD